ncbi:MAG: MBL fold metallo-hydrolase [Hyphomicrobiales bacterium]
MTRVHPIRRLGLPAALTLLLSLGLAGPSPAEQVYLPGAKPAIPPKDSTLTITVRPLAPGAYAAKVNTVWTGWVELPDGILVVDATMADSAGAALADTIRARSPGKPFEYLVLTSAHLDHITGAPRFLGAGARLVAQASVADEIDSTLGITPDSAKEIRVKNRERLGTAAEPVDVVWLGRDAASRGDLVVWLPKQRILYGGDLVTNRSVPWLMDRDFDADGWIASIDSLFTKAFAIDTVVPGHGDIGSANQALNFTKYYIQDARKKASEYAAWNASVLAVKQWGYLGAYEGLEFYDEIHWMNMRRLYWEAKGIKTPGRGRVSAIRK